jgi:transglutaminase-like putative cysteine protease
MKELTLLASRSDPRIRELSLMLSTGLRMSGPVDAAQSIEAFIRRAYVFVDEPEELLIDPSAQLDYYERDGRIHGDCDDAAMLAASLLYAIGLQVRFKAVNPMPDGSFSHVFMEYYHDGLGRWIPVDPTIDGIPVYVRPWISERL